MMFLFKEYWIHAAVFLLTWVIGLALISMIPTVPCLPSDPPGPTIGGAILLYGCPVRR